MKKNEQNFAVGTHLEKNNDFFLIFFFSVVIETLKTVDKDRKCFRMVGGILSERTVKDVLPKLENNRIQVRA